MTGQSLVGPVKAQCAGTVKSTGKRCTRPPIKGGTVCRVHGGAAPQVKAKAARNALTMRINGQLVREHIDPVTDPVSYYARLAGEMWAFKELAAQQMEELDDWVLTLTGPGNTELGEQARAVIGVYQAAVAQCDRTLGNMVRLGLDAEALRVSQERPSREQGERLAAGVKAVLGHELLSHLSVEERQTLLGVLRAELES
jgi:hypothetical protein